MERVSHLSLDVRSAGAAPYFTWDSPVTNGQIRHALREGDEDERLHWIARILREAKYEDVWAYLTLRGDILPSWDRVRTRLGRRRAMWEFLLARWRALGLV